MGTLLNRRRYMGGVKGLPYDAEIEYLESTGTQWIDLGFKATREIDVDIYINRSANSILFDCGAEDGWSSKIARFLIIRNDSCYWRFYNGGSAITRSQNLVGDIRLQGNKTSGIVTNITTGDTYNKNPPSSQDFETTGNFILFGVTVGSSPSVESYSSGVRVYSAKITDTGANLDLIPVRVGQTGYLYDKNSGTLFGNAGSGTFILGPDKT